MSMNRKASPVRGRPWSALAAILALSVVFTTLGAWEIQRGAATVDWYAEPTGWQGKHPALSRSSASHDPATNVRLPGSPLDPLPGATIADSGNTQDVAAADLLVARLRQAAAWLTLLAAITSGVAGSAGMLLVARSAHRSFRSRSDLVAAFGRVSRALPILLGTQVIGVTLALAGAVTFEVAGLWFAPDPGDRTVLLAILVVVWTGVALWGAVTTLRDLRRALQAFVPAP